MAGETTMNISMISAAAALIGTAMGGITSLLSSWIIQRRAVRAQSLAMDIGHRQELYKEFIEEASKCYADAIQHDKPDIPSLVILYGKMSRMRVLSSPEVIKAADDVMLRIVELYSRPPVVLTTASFQALGRDGSVDPLRGFSEACRAEFDFLRGREF